MRRRRGDETRRRRGTRVLWLRLRFCSGSDRVILSGATRSAG